MFRTKRHWILYVPCVLSLCAYGCSSEDAESVVEEDRASSSSGRAASSSSGRAGDEDAAIDAATSDSGSAPADGGAADQDAQSDAGEPSQDAGDAQSDAGEPSQDAGDAQSDAGAPGSCRADIGPVGYELAPSPQGYDHCSAAQISSFFDACFNSGDAAVCDTFLTSNQSCSACLTGTQTEWGSIVSVPYLGQEVSIVNYRVCVAKLAGLNAACTSSMGNMNVCAHYNCDSCGDAESHQQCFMSTLTEGDLGCRDLTVVADACVQDVADLQGLYDECGANEPSFELMFSKTANILCGPGR